MLASPGAGRSSCTCKLIKLENFEFCTHLLASFDDYGSIFSYLPPDLLLHLMKVKSFPETLGKSFNFYVFGLDIEFQFYARVYSLDTEFQFQASVYGLDTGLLRIEDIFTYGELWET